jgi:uncharacterized protein YbjQ (UPF0145 family)
MPFDPFVWQVGLVALLAVAGFLVGGWQERRHYRSILAREAALRHVLIISVRRVPEDAPGLGPSPETRLVRGSAVISVDYFKRFLAGLRMLFGGRVTTYESLVDRARREALLRMRAEADAAGARMVVNVRMETASISKGAGRAVGAVEVVAYGTAAIPAAAGAARLPGMVPS